MGRAHLSPRPLSQQESVHFPEVLLVIEAATAAGSVALVRNGEDIIERAVVMGAAREDALMPAIAAVLQDASLSMRDVRAIACGSGPGSFTSLRIAAALAKGLAQASNIGLYAIPSMLLAALELRTRPGTYLLHSDALRGERFAQLFNVAEGEHVRAASSLERRALADVEHEAASANALLFAVGPKVVSANDSGHLLPRAGNAAALVRDWHLVPAVDVAAWEPTYGRLAEAQVKWEETNQRALPTN